MISGPLFQTTKGQPLGLKVEFLNDERVNLLKRRMLLFWLLKKPLQIREDIQGLLARIGLIILEGHQLSEPENKCADVKIHRTEEPGIIGWHEDACTWGVNILHRNPSDPVRNDKTCFTSAEHVYSQLQPHWSEIREALKSTLLESSIPHDFRRLDEAINWKESLRFIIQSLEKDLNIRREALKKIDNNDPRHVFKYAWDLQKSQTAIFWSSMLTPGVPVANHILHGGEADPSVSVSELEQQYVRRLLIQEPFYSRMWC